MQELLVMGLTACSCWRLQTIRQAGGGVLLCRVGLGFKLQLANVMELKVSVMRRLLVAGSAETVGVSETAWSKK